MIRCIVGLGNPGPRFANSRHNLGFCVADALVSSAGSRWAWRWFRPYWHAWMYVPKPVLCCKPATWMNRSGVAVAAVCRRLGLGPNEVLVVCDDVHLPLGRMRARDGGSAGGHNGLMSVIEALGTDAVARLRLGVGEGPNGRVNHVLGSFSDAERPVVDEVVRAAALAAVQTTLDWNVAVQQIAAWLPATRD